MCLTTTQCTKYHIVYNTNIYYIHATTIYPSISSINVEEYNIIRVKVSSRTSSQIKQKTSQ